MIYLQFNFYTIFNIIILIFFISFKNKFILYYIYLFLNPSHLIKDYQRSFS